MRFLLTLLAFLVCLCVVSAFFQSPNGIISQLKNKFNKKFGKGESVVKKPGKKGRDRDNDKPAEADDAADDAAAGNDGGKRTKKQGRKKGSKKTIIKPMGKPTIPTISSGTPSHSPERCDYCGENAYCKAKKCCQCRPGYTGNPYFLCSKPRAHDVCQICDDPVIETESNSRSRVHYLGSTLLMDKIVKTSGKKCNIRVIVSNKRVRGKFLPKCLFVRLDLDYNGKRKDCSLIYKICAQVSTDWTISWTIRYGTVQPNGVIRYTDYQTMTSAKPRLCANRKCNCKVDFRVTASNLLTMDAKCCEFKLGFRPYVKKSAWLKSGVFLLTKKSLTKNVLPSNLTNYGLCLTHDITIPDLQNHLGLTDERFHATSHLALTNLPPNDDMVTLNPGQGEMARAIRNCNRLARIKFYNQLEFLAENPVILHALAGEVEGLSEIIALVEHAANWICRNLEESCKVLKKTLNDRCGHLYDRFPELKDFVEAGCP